MTSASLLIVLFVGTVVGAVTGLVVGGSFNPDGLAILAGFLGALIAGDGAQFHHRKRRGRRP